MVESVELGPHKWDIESSVPGRVKSMTYKIDTYYLLAWHWTLMRQGCQDKYWLARQDNLTQWDSTIGSWCWWPEFPVGQHYKVGMSVHCRKSIAVLTWP